MSSSGLVIPQMQQIHNPLPLLWILLIERLLFVQGMAGYMTGMMVEDPQAIDEFISELKSKPELYEQVKLKIEQSK